MADMIVTYETLFDVLRKEKARSELQQLPADFYGQVVAYLRKKKGEVDAAGGIGSPAGQKPLIQFRNVQKILRELYERRERKIIEMALTRVRTESNIVDTSTLLAEEQHLCQASVDLLGSCKHELLEPALRGEAPVGVVVPDISASVPEPSPTAEPVISGGESEGRTPEAIATQESCRVRFVASVPRFLGLKGEIHGPFEPGETVELPGKIAAVLLKKKRVDIS